MELIYIIKRKTK